jgi:hypothetical protein
MPNLELRFSVLSRPADVLSSEELLEIAIKNNEKIA